MDMGKLAVVDPSLDFHSDNIEGSHKIVIKGRYYQDSYLLRFLDPYEGASVFWGIFWPVALNNQSIPGYHIGAAYCKYPSSCLTTSLPLCCPYTRLYLSSNLGVYIPLIVLNEKLHRLIIYAVSGRL